MADLNEKQIYEALGIDYPDAGANEQDPADPAQEAQEGADRGANGQEVAEPAQAQQSPQEDGDGQGDDQNTDNPEMDAKTRHENAARRRQQEQQKQQAAIDKAVEEALALERQRSAQQLESIFTRAGLKNTVTGAPIKTQADFDAWERIWHQQQLVSQVEAGQLTPEMLDRVISEHPDVKRAQALIQAQQQLEQQRAEEAAQRRIEADLAKIRALDPDVTTVEQLFAGRYGQQIMELTEKGLDLAQAYYLATREDRERAIAELARQQAALQARGKQHLIPNGNAAGEGAAAVPQDQLAMYRMFMPNASEAEIQAHYNKHIKRN